MEKDEELRNYGAVLKKKRSFQIETKIIKRKIAFAEDVGRNRHPFFVITRKMMDFVKKESLAWKLRYIEVSGIEALEGKRSGR